MATTADLLPPDPQAIDGNPGAGRIRIALVPSLAEPR